MRTTISCKQWRALVAGGFAAGALLLSGAAVTAPAGATTLPASIAIPSETPFDRALDAIALREYAQSLNLLRIASAAGDMRADLLLADQLARGLGTPRNDAEALRAHERAAARGSNAARALLALNTIRSGAGKSAASQALLTLKGLAVNGEPVAQREWGVILLEGRLQPRDVELAVGWLHRAAQAGDARAQAMYGELFLQGKGVNAHAPTAIDWLQQSAQKDDPQGQYLLGGVFRDGHGVEQDVIEGAYWMDRAATQGWTDAQWALSQMYVKGGALVPRPDQARRWMLAAARPHCRLRH